MRTVRSGGRYISNWLPVIKASLVYLVAVCSLLALYGFVADHWLMAWYLKLNASLTGFIVNLSWVDVSTEATVILADSFGMKIIPECTPLLPTAILVSGVVASSGSWLYKLIGVSGGILALSVINLVRTTTLFFVGLWAPSQFDTAHLLVWQSLMILATVALWVIWHRSRRYVMV